jgi:hypothetical protein
MPEIMYASNSFLIVGILLVLLLLGNELGYRSGARHRVLTDESNKAQINTIQASLLGILGLLLGFTFSLSLQRYDSRSIAVVDEANAIGTAYLRSSLLPLPYGAETQGLLREYLDLRVQSASHALGDRAEWEVLLSDADRKLGDLWYCADLAIRADERPVVSGLFVQSLNALIDSFDRRNAALNRHVPELVLILLFGTFILTGSMVGYTSGFAGRRAIFPTYVLMALIVLVVFLIIDLDRPRRGLVVVSHKSLVDLHSKLHGSTAISAPRDSTTPAISCNR